MNKTLTSLLLAGLAGLTGCTTANYEVKDSTSLPKQTIQGFTAMANRPVSTNYQALVQQSTPYTNIATLADRYGRLPSQKVDVYFATQGSTNRPSLETLNTTGPANAALPVVQRLEQNITNYAQVFSFTLGNADRTSFVGSQSANNQLSNESGLLGIDSYYNPGTNGTKGKFFIQVNEVDGLKGVHENKHYNVSVTFGKDAIRARKTRKDGLIILRTLTESASAYGAAGLGGPIGPAAGAIVDGTWSYFEGRNAPKGNNLSQGRWYADGLEKSVSDTLAILNQTKDRGANDIIVVPYDHGTGVIYAKDASNIRVAPNKATFETTQAGANILSSYLFSAIKAAATMGSAEAIDSNFEDESSPGQSNFSPVINGTPNFNGNGSGSPDGQ